MTQNGTQRSNGLSRHNFERALLAAGSGLGGTARHLAGRWSIAAALPCGTT
ncbi:hypothetical protein OK015_07135 [Mycobacterium sp. Aquia_216]|uniref:hypothetical protein n=1 Tax=Mycobacterium sp. Aquia_216 TaxID=2991729 RepID=UPI00227B6115|nr:hypothetical protein [Mycobacterium sp. Aquia_216]WAJ46246.1 hypothetical protein OK015_07135 [Mycobacterium sp. Aquia_216]